MYRLLPAVLLLISSASMVHAASFDAGTFGHMKGVLDVCGRVSPQKASQYLLQMKAVIGKASRAEVDQAMKSDEYQQEYQTVRSQVNGLTPQGLATACDSYLSSE